MTNERTPSLGSGAKSLGSPFIARASIRGAEPETPPREGGHVVAGRYQLVQQFGQGGMGAVWRAQDLTLGSLVALKLIDAALARDEGLSARFHQEAKSAASLRSPHVVQILDYGVDQGIPFIAMELLEGETLGERLQRVRILPYPETVRVLMDVARAMKKAHEAGIVHRDMKPDNIFLVRNDDQEVAKVLDFGIAKTTDPMGAQKASTRTGTLLGTLPYMSPEQAQGTKDVDWRTDLWAMGAIAFQCVCGRVPFNSEATGEIILQICALPLPVPSEIAPVPEGFDEWWARAANREPGERFQTAKELVDALAVVLTPDVVQVSSASLSDPPPPRESAPAARGANPTTFGRSAVETPVITPKNKSGSSALIVAGIAAIAAAIAIIVSASRGMSPGAPRSAAAGFAVDVDAGAPAASAPPPALPVVTAPVVAPADTAPEPTAKPVEKPRGPARRVHSVAPPPPVAAQPTPPPPAPSTPPKVADAPGKDRIGF